VKIRKFLRQPLVQTALLKLPNTDEIPCEIRNFCQAGLFLKLIRPRAIQENPNQTAEAEVIFISYRAENIFRLNGRLVHVSPTGAGIVFDHPPPFHVLQALQEVALADPLSDRPVPEEYTPIVEQCSKVLETTLQTLFEPVSIQIGKQLREENHATPAVQPEEQGRLIVEQFCTYALAQAKNFVVPDLSLQPESGAIYTESQQQRLIFKDWMNLMDKIIHLESKYDATLKLLEARFSFLVHREIVNYNNPFGPSVLLHTFHYSLQELQLSNDHRCIVYETITRLLDEGLDTLYNDLRVLSKPLDALTQSVSLDSKPSTLPAELDGIYLGASPAKSEGANKTFFPSPNVIPESADLSPPPRDKPTVELKPPQSKFQILGAKQPRSAATSPAASQRRPVNIPHQPDAFTAFVVLTRYAEAQANKATAADAEFDRFEVIGALAKQLHAANRDKTTPYFSAPRLQEDLKQILIDAGQEKAFAHRELKENLQILGLLLDAMLSDMSTPTCITPYIMKLQLPLIIASFADPGLLYDKTHPGRELLNQLDCLTQAANSQGEFDNPQVRQSLDTLFSRINKEVANNPQIFAEALEAIEKLTAPLLKAYATRLERLVESCEGGQRLEQARQSVEREIESRIAGKTVPAVVQSLLDSGWRQLLVLTNLRQGTDNDDWRRQLASVDLLNNWLSAQAAAPPPSQIKSLKKYIREGLSSVNAEPVEVNLFLEKIDNLLPEDGRTPNQPVYIDILPTDTTKIERENALGFRLAGFKAGDWLKFISTQNAWIPLRLAWIGQEPSRFIFTNRKGVKSLELDAAKFAQILDEKRASRIESLDAMSLVERTAKSLLSTLRDRLR